MIRIAKDAKAAAVNLRNEAGNSVLTATAKSPGLSGEAIRLGVTYRGLNPEATFDMEVFQWTQNSQGDQVKSSVELFAELTMDPNTARYAVDQVNNNSNLISLTDLNVSAAEGSTIRPTRTNLDEATFRTEWRDLIGTASVGGINQIPHRVDGNAFCHGGPVVRIDLEQDRSFQMHAGIWATQFRPSSTPRLLDRAVLWLAMEDPPTAATPPRHRFCCALPPPTATLKLNLPPAMTWRATILGAARAGSEV